MAENQTRERFISDQSYQEAKADLASSWRASKLRTLLGPLILLSLLTGLIIGGVWAWHRVFDPDYLFRVHDDEVCTIMDIQCCGKFDFGLSKQDVIKLFGEPAQRTTDTDDNGDISHWTWGRSDGIVHIDFYPGDAGCSRYFEFIPNDLSPAMIFSDRLPPLVGSKTYSIKIVSDNFTISVKIKEDKILSVLFSPPNG